jgi:hypothetical protein
MQSQARNLTIATAALVAIGASIFLIYKSQREPTLRPTVQIHGVLGEALAEETIKITGGQGQIVVVTLDHGQSVELDRYYKAFKDALKKSALKILRTDTVSAEKSSKYGPGAGMSGRRYEKLISNYPNAAAIVSLVGIPHPNDDELKALKGKTIPRFVAFSRNAKDLDELIKEKWVTVAIVPRFADSASAPHDPKTPREWFDKEFQIVRAN